MRVLDGTKVGGIRVELAANKGHKCWGWGHGQGAQRCRLGNWRGARQGMPRSPAASKPPPEGVERQVNLLLGAQPLKLGHAALQQMGYEGF